jgi:hypothetical protein
MHARYYTPEWGRFWSVDPIGGTPGMPQSWNAYAYVMGNPVNLYDPWGMEVECSQSSDGGIRCEDEITVTGEADDLRPLPIPGSAYWGPIGGSQHDHVLGVSPFTEPDRTLILGVSAAAGLFASCQVEAGLYHNPNDWGIYALYGVGPGFGMAAGITGGYVRGGEGSVSGVVTEAQFYTPIVGGSGFLDMRNTSQLVPPITGGAVSGPGPGFGFFLTENHAGRISIPDTSNRMDAILLQGMYSFCSPSAWGF